MFSADVQHIYLAITTNINVARNENLPVMPRPVQSCRERRLGRSLVTK
jgi:hypothetical protein